MTDETQEQLDELEDCLLTMRQCIDNLSSILDKQKGQKLRVPTGSGESIEIDMNRE